MICPHCKTPMTDEQVFCENCGKERQLVPVYDARIDETLETTISGIAVELANTQEIKPVKSETLIRTDAETEENAPGEEGAGELNIKQEHGRKSASVLLFIGLGIFAVVLLVLLVVASFMLKEQSSYDFNVKKAEEMAAVGNYEQMLEYAGEAMNIAPNSSDARMLIARAYEGMGDEKNEQKMLEELLYLDSAYEPAYELLIPIYREEKDYGKIADLLAKCSQQPVLDAYAEYLATPPQVSEEPGRYEEAVALKLIVPGGGKIYYTLDGTNPTEADKEYITPILLHSGRYTVKAIYVNTYGITSNIMQADYYINEKTMDAPQINPESGTYTEPRYITVSVPDDHCQVYYTTDGTEPGLESTLYTGAIPMPLGDSKFAFVIYDEGEIPGEVAYATYHLELDLSFTAEQAANMLIQTLISQGIILDADGHIPDMEGKRQYPASAVIAENDQYYYLVDEVFIAPDGTSQKTGNQYAVSVTTGESFLAVRNSYGMYDLKRIQQF